METLPDADMQTTERLLHSDDKAAAGAAILSAVVAFLCASTSREQTATILREWAHAVEASRTPVIGHG